MSITSRTLKDGTTVYDVREYVGFTLDGKRDRECVTCLTRREAEREQARMIAMRDARRNRSGHCTFGQYVDRWYWPSTSSLAPTSRDTYRRELDKRLRPVLENVDIRDIDRLRIQKIVDGCATENVARKCVGVLKTILNEAKGDQLITSNPAEARFKLPPKGRKRDNGIVITTFEAMHPLIDAIDEYGDECIEKIAMTGLHMGLRPEERYGLDLEDVRTDLAIVSVRQAYIAASTQEGGRQLKDTKTELSERDVPMPKSLIPRMERLAPSGSSGPFITGADGKRISPSTAQKRWKAFLRWCEEKCVDVPHVTIENMHHSFATSFLHAGGNIEDLSRILGHSDINTTYRRYVRPNVDDLRRGMDAVSVAMRITACKSLCYNVFYQIERRCDMASATMTVRMDDCEKALILDYAKTFGTSASDFMRRTALERIEDELDLKAWNEAKAEFDADPVIIPAAEIAKKYL